MFVERIELEERVRYVTQFGERIAVWLDTNELVLFSIEARKDPLADTVAWLSETHDADQAGRIERMLTSCGECHSYLQSAHAGAPSLNGVVGREIGSTGYESYSDALAGHGGRPRRRCAPTCSIRRVLRLARPCPIRASQTTTP